MFWFVKTFMYCRDFMFDENWCITRFSNNHATSDKNRLITVINNSNARFVTIHVRVTITVSKQHFRHTNDRKIKELFRNNCKIGNTKTKLCIHRLYFYEWVKLVRPPLLIWQGFNGCSNRSSLSTKQLENYLEGDWHLLFRLDYKDTILQKIKSPGS